MAPRMLRMTAEEFDSGLQSLRRMDALCFAGQETQSRNCRCHHLQFWISQGSDSCGKAPEWWSGSYSQGVLEYCIDVPYGIALLVWGFGG